jgi:hypothetical protein
MYKLIARVYLLIMRGSVYDDTWGFPRQISITIATWNRVHAGLDTEVTGGTPPPTRFQISWR